MKRLKKGDKVRVISGKEKGKEGVILKILTKQNKAEVEKVNVYKKHQKANRENQEGGIVEVNVPIDLSKLALIDPKGKGKTTKVKFGFDKANKKVRVAKLTNTEIVKG